MTTADLSSHLLSDLLPLAYLCQDVYRDDHRTDLLNINFSQTIHRKLTDTYCVAYVSDTDVYIVFRGSSRWKDWTSNAQVIKRNYAGIRAHRGFAVAAKRIEKEIFHIVENFPDRKITLAGHSRGGAIAVLLAASIRLHLRSVGALRPVRVVTYGQPRVSTETELNLAIYGDYYRVQNSSDVVCRVPRLGYSHAGINLYLTRNNELLINPSSLRKAMDRAPHLWSRGTTHTTNNYIRAIKRSH